MASRKVAKKSTKSAASDKAADECFTIMPFGGWFDDYYADIFCPAIQNAGLSPRRADDLYRPSAIVHDIWAYTRSCRLVLADLTGKNPNVFYELGLAHAIAKPAVLVTESMADVPFDLRALRVIEYDKNAPAWGDVLRDKIENAIREVLASPLQSVLPSFLEVGKSKQPTVSEHQKEMLEIRQEIELLKREVRRSYEARRHDYPMGPEETLTLMRRYIEMGMPRDMVASRLLRRGAHPSFVMQEIDRHVAASRPPQLGLEDAQQRVDGVSHHNSPASAVNSRGDR